MDVRLKFSPVFRPQISGSTVNKRLEISIRAMVEFSEGNRFLAFRVFDHGDLGRSGVAKLMGNTFIDGRQSSPSRQLGHAVRVEWRRSATSPNGTALASLWIVCEARA